VIGLDSFQGEQSNVRVLVVAIFMEIMKQII